MKAVTTVLLFLLLMAPSALSQVPDDKLIVPGQRIGKWTLAMTIADLTQMNGAPLSIGPNFAQDAARENVVHIWDRVFAATSTSDQQRIEILGTGSEDFKTEKGIGAGSRREAVEAAYGRPTAETRATDTWMRLIYDEVGLAIRITRVLETVARVDVFRPGTGRQLWRF